MNSIERIEGGSGKSAETRPLQGRMAGLARVFFFFAAACCGATLLAGCAGEGGAPADGTKPGRLHVVATTPPLADWAREVTGDKAEVTCLLPPGASAHTFDPSPREMRAVGDARVFLKVGLKLDDWAAQLAAVGPKGMQVVALGEELRASGKLPDVSKIAAAALAVGDEATTGGHSQEGHVHDHECEAEHGGTDPHYWLDPQLARLSVARIGEALAAADPPNAAAYRANAARYAEQLSRLDSETAAQLKPVAGGSIATFHNAFAYFAARYGLGIAAVIEEYPGKTPSERYVKAVTAKLRTAGIRRIFTEPQFNARVAEIIATEIGGTVAILDPHGTPGNPERDTYEKIIRFNARQIAEALKK